MPEFSIDPEDVAAICHEANRAYCEYVMCDTSQTSWETAPHWQKESALKGVYAVQAGKTPEQLHEAWSNQKRAEGWVYGPTKDARQKTHPCLVPYDDLPEDQKKKDFLFHAVARTFLTE